MTNMTLQDVLGEQIRELQSLNMSVPMEQRDFVLKKADTTARVAKQFIDNTKCIIEADKMSGWTARVDKVVGE